MSPSPASVGGEVVSGIDFEPATGRLFALDITDEGATRRARRYALDLVSGVATLVCGISAGDIQDTGAFGFDINPLNGVSHHINRLDGSRTLTGSSADGITASPRSLPTPPSAR